MKYLPLKIKFCSIFLYNQPFSRYCTFYNYPLTMLNTKKAPKENCQNSKFDISKFLTNFGRDPP